LIPKYFDGKAPILIASNSDSPRCKNNGIDHNKPRYKHNLENLNFNRIFPQLKPRRENNINLSHSDLKLRIAS
jgi:hypothetical protein